MSSNEPETAGNENPSPSSTPPETSAIVATGAGTATADGGASMEQSAVEERLNALVLSTPRASGVGRHSGGSTAAGGTLWSGGSKASSTTPLSSAKASRNHNVVGDGSFEEMMKERATVCTCNGHTLVIRVAFTRTAVVIVIGISHSKIVSPPYDNTIPHKTSTLYGGK